MSFDQALFEPIYGLAGNPILDQVMLFSAEYLVLLIPFTLIYIWFQKKEGKKDSMFTAYSTVAGILFSYLMGFFYAHENPSAFYDTLVAFHPENSFPSQHTTALFAASLPLIYKKRNKLGWTILATAVLTGFARIYIGEHWPIDILGAALAGGAGLAIAYISWSKLEPIWKPLIELAEEIEEKIVSIFF